MQVKVKILDPKAVIPVKSHDDDFCYDLIAVSCTELAPGVYRYGFGIALQLKEEDDDSIVTGFTIRPRSSVWKTGMVLSNSLGTIDRGYTGEISADCLQSSGKLLGVTYRSNRCRPSAM